MKTALFIILAIARVSFADPGRLIRLANRVAAVAPGASMSVGDMRDKATWKVEFPPDATAEQRSNAANVISTWTPQDWEPGPKEIRKARVQQECDPLVGDAVVLRALADAEANPTKKAAYQVRLDRILDRLVRIRKRIEAETPGGDE